MFRQKAWFSLGIGVSYKFEVVFYFHPFHNLEKMSFLPVLEHVSHASSVLTIYLFYNFPPFYFQNKKLTQSSVHNLMRKYRICRVKIKVYIYEELDCRVLRAHHLVQLWTCFHYNVEKQNFADFQDLKISPKIKKIGPDRFSRFDVYWIQTDRQTSQIKFIYRWNQ